MCRLVADRRSCRRSGVKLLKPIVNRYARWLCSFGGFLVSIYFLLSRNPHMHGIGRLSICTAESSGLRRRSLLPTWGFRTARRITSDCRRSLNSRFRTLFLTSITIPIKLSIPDSLSMTVARSGGNASQKGRCKGIREWNLAPEGLRFLRRVLSPSV